MRIVVDAAPGELADRPDAAIAALAGLAVADGAVEADWLTKAAKRAGASSVEVAVPMRQSPYAIVNEANEAIVKLYEHTCVALVRAVEHALWTAANVIDNAALAQVYGVGDDLAKAIVKPTRLITPDVAQRVAAIVNQYHASIAAAVFGKGAVSQADWELAITLGLVDPAGDPAGIAGGLHAYGALIAHLDQAAHSDRYGMTAADFVAYVEKHPIPQTEQEHRSAQYVAQRGASAIVGLGNRAGATLGSALIEADKAQDERLRAIMRDVIAARFGDDEAAARVKAAGLDAGKPASFFDDMFRETIGKVASDIGHATKDWARDVKRIAHTETQTAVQEGIKDAWTAQETATAVAQKRPPARVLAFKLPHASACEHCIDLHTEGGVPRIFYLDVLQANGTNVGRKASEWRAVVGPVHPFCLCSLSKVPAVLTMPTGWASGQTAPSVIGPGGQLVIP